MRHTRWSRGNSFLTWYKYLFYCLIIFLDIFRYFRLCHNLFNRFKKPHYESEKFDVLLWYSAHSNLRYFCLLVPVGAFVLEVLAEENPAWSTTQLFLAFCSFCAPECLFASSFSNFASCQNEAIFVTTVHRVTVFTFSHFWCWLSGRTYSRSFR